MLSRLKFAFELMKTQLLWFKYNNDNNISLVLLIHLIYDNYIFYIKKKLNIL